jgi:hypothetical protein
MLCISILIFLFLLVGLRIIVYTNEVAITAWVLGILFISLIVGLLYYDYSSLTHYSYNARIADKWHEEECTPITDEKGNYAGESCSDVYTVVLITDNNRFEEKLSVKEFKNLPVNTDVFYSFDTGKLGLKHNLKIEPITQFSKIR